jgi:hypothetical protein
VDFAQSTPGRSLSAAASSDGPGPPDYGQNTGPSTSTKGKDMNNIFYIIGVVVVVLIVLGYFGFR